MSPSDSILIIGAGSIGRGLLADLATEGGWHPVFIEADRQKAEALLGAGSYCVRRVGRSPAVRTIEGFDVITPDAPDRVASAVRESRFAATAVGGLQLPEVGRMLAPSVNRRTRALNIVVCENFPNATGILEKSLLEAGALRGSVACVRASVERMARPVENCLDVLVESEETLFVDGGAWGGPRPAIPGLTFRPDIERLYFRKLYTNNAGHAALAYLGAEKEIDLLPDALDLPDIRRVLVDLLNLAGRGLCRRFGFDAWEMKRHVDTLILHRYSCRELGDTVRRVGRDPLRKLGLHERLVGLLRLLQATGLPATPVSRVLAAVLRYFDPNDAESIRLRQRVNVRGPEYVLQNVSGIRPEEPCFREILDFHAVTG